MAVITKNLLLELLSYAYRHKILKTAVRDRYDPKFAGKSKEDCVNFIVQNLKIDEITELLLENFHTVHQTFYLLEPIDSKPFLDSAVKASLKRLSLPSIDSEEVVSLSKCADGVSIHGMLRTFYDGFEFDEKTEVYKGGKRTLPFLIPFKINFTAPKHVKIRIMKFSPAKFHRIATGELIDIRSHNFKPELAVMHLLNKIIPKVLDADLIQSNLTTGIKNLVAASKLGAIQAGADDGDAEGRNNRTKHKTSKGSLLESDWYATYLLPSKKLDTGRWFWTDGLPPGSDVGKLDCVTVDCEAGTCSKDKSDEQDHEWLVDEILRHND